MRSLYESLLGGDIKGITSDMDNACAEDMAEWLKSQPHCGAYEYSWAGNRFSSDSNHIRVEGDKISCDELSFQSIKEFPDGIKFKNVDLLTSIGAENFKNQKFPQIDKLKELHIFDNELNRLEEAFKSIKEIEKIKFNWLISTRTLRFPSFHIPSVVVPNDTWGSGGDKSQSFDKIEGLDANGLIYKVTNCLWDFGIESPKRKNSKPEFKDYEYFKQRMNKFFEKNPVRNVIITARSLGDEDKSPWGAYGYYVGIDKKTGEYTLKTVCLAFAYSMLNRGKKL